MVRGKPKLIAMIDDFAWGKEDKPMKSIPIKKILTDPYLSKLGKEIIFID